MRRTTAIVALLSAMLAAALPGTAMASGAYEASRPAGTAHAEQLALQHINQYRRSKGREPLKVDPRLERVARWMARDMVVEERFSHVDSLGRDPFQRFDELGYPDGVWRGENLAAANAGAKTAVRQWKDSPTHDENLLNPEYRYAGIARVKGGEHGWYWALELGAAPLEQRAR